MVAEQVGPQHSGRVGMGAVEEEPHEGLRLPVAGNGGQCRMPAVAGEDLVGALAALDDLDLLGDQFGQQVEGDHVVTDHRLAHGGDRAVQGGGEAVGVHHQLVVVGGELLRDQIGVRELVTLLAALRLETDAEGGHLRPTRLGEQRHDQAGVEAAGEQDAHRHVTDDATAHRGTQCVQYRVAPVGGVEACVFGTPGVRGLPVAAVAVAAVRFDDPHGGGWQLAHPLQDGARGRHRAVQGKELMQRVRVEGGVDAASREQGGQ